MRRRITDPYEVLGLERGATDAEVRAAHLRLAKKHHPDKNAGDKASEWIFKEVQRAYETLRDAKDIQPAGEEQSPRAQEDEHARTRRGQRPPPPGDRAERDQRERDARTSQRGQQQAQSGPKPTCHCGSVIRWWTRLPLIVRLIGAWVKWALGVVVGAFGLGFFMTLGVSALAWLLSLLGLPLPGGVVASGVYLVTFGLAFGLVLWVAERPKVCPRCGCVSSRLWE